MARAGSKIHRIMDVNPPYLPCADDYTGTYMNVSILYIFNLKPKKNLKIQKKTKKILILLGGN